MLKPKDTTIKTSAFWASTSLFSNWIINWPSNVNKSAFNMLMFHLYLPLYKTFRKLLKEINWCNTSINFSDYVTRLFQHSKTLPPAKAAAQLLPLQPPFDLLSSVSGGPTQSSVNGKPTWKTHHRGPTPPCWLSHPWTRSYIYWLLTVVGDNTVIDAYHCSHCNFIDPPSHSTKGYGDGRLRQVARLPRTAGAISMSGRGSFVARPCCLFHISYGEQQSAALKIRSPSLKCIISNDSPHNLLQKTELQVESNLQFFYFPENHHISDW